MAAGDREIESLAPALAEMSAAEVQSVVAEARAEARARVKAALVEAFSESLERAVREQLGGGVTDVRASTEGGEARPAAGGQAQEEGSATPVALGCATYVYGVIWADDAVLAHHLNGLAPDGTVEAVIEGRLAAVTSQVPLAEFDEQELRSRLSDITWVERVARAHEAVLDDLVGATVVIPMRMCTVYRSDANVRSMLRREELNLKAALEVLEGKLEWGVRVTAGADERPAGAGGRGAESAAAAEDARAASSGADYLARRRAQRDAREQQDRILADAAAEIHEALGSQSHAALLNPTQPADGASGEAEVVLNGVYLVERDGTERFHKEVESLREQFASLGLELIETGPWPPYNFVPGDVGAAW